MNCHSEPSPIGEESAFLWQRIDEHVGQSGSRSLTKTVRDDRFESVNIGACFEAARRNVFTSEAKTKRASQAQVQQQSCRSPAIF
jgi:hypothetical protein